jgi:hypothetical protein
MGVVEGEQGRVSTRKLSGAHRKPRQHDGFVRAVDLELPLLRLQHEKIDP